jgi:hypothetical protein
VFYEETCHRDIVQLGSAYQRGRIKDRGIGAKIMARIVSNAVEFSKAGFNIRA